MLVVPVCTGKDDAFSVAIGVQSNMGAVGNRGGFAGPPSAWLLSGGGNSVGTEQPVISCVSLSLFI